MNTSLLVTATKEFTWDMAHMLAGHRGLCKNLHGHTYKMLVTVARKDKPTEASGPAEGMVIDFKALKEIVKELIVDKYDHAVILNGSTTSGFEKELIALVEKYDKKAVILDYRPTAEEMARHFFDDIKDALEEKMPQVMLVQLRLYETPTSYAEVSMQEVVP